MGWQMEVDCRRAALSKKPKQMKTFAIYKLVHGCNSAIGRVFVTTVVGTFEDAVREADYLTHPHAFEVIPYEKPIL
jgi:hypothetical protein